MLEIGAVEAESKLGVLLDQVARGEEIVITRDGQPVARLVREDRTFDRDKARRAAAEILAMSRGVTLGDVTLRELIDEGRR